MVAVAGGIHGTMDDFDQRLGVMELAIRQLPENLGEHWQAVIDMIQTLKNEGTEFRKESEMHKKEIVQMAKSDENNKSKIAAAENEIASAHSIIRAREKDCQ